MTTHIVAACLLDSDRRLLVVKLAHQSFWTLPGGAPSAQHGETPLMTLSRYCEQHLGQTPGARECIMLGRFRSQEDDTPVDADVFVIEDFNGKPTAGGELEALQWIALDDDTSSLSPLLRDDVLPTLRKRFG